jgi:hypothetical protein
MIKRDPIERFMEKVSPEPNSGCWLWIGKTHKQNDYGVFSVGHARHEQAHRWFYERVRAPVARELELDHLCRVRSCVNPDHLEPVTRRVNQLRGNGFVARHAVKTKCPQGHPYSPENTYMYRGSRYCQICRDAHRLKNRLKNKQVRALPLLFLEDR